MSLDRLPVITVCPLYSMSMLLLLTMAVHPASHNCPTDSKLCVIISGTMCDTVAAGGNVGILMCPSCVDVIVLPSGIVIRIGMSDFVMLTRLLFGVERCVVHPVSMIVGISLCVGGPKFDKLLNAFFILVLSFILSLGSPRRQFVVSDVAFFLFFPM